MPTFADLLNEYMGRTGIADAELARRMEISRLTLIRWKEGVTTRPRHRDDVLRSAQVLRLTPEERDGFLLAAGFAPENVLSQGEAEPVETSETPETAGQKRAGPRGFLRQRAVLMGLAAALVMLVAAGSLVAAMLTGAAPEPTPQLTLPPEVAPTLPPAVGTTVEPIPPLETVVEPITSTIVIAPFLNYAAGQQGFNVRGRIRNEVEREIGAAGVRNVEVEEWPEPISNERAAADAARESGATILIWGEYDSGRVVAILTISRSPEDTYHQRIVDTPASPEGLPASINIGLPDEVRSIALLTLGQLYLEQGEHDRAKTVLIQALARPPIDPGALASLRYRLGRAYMGGKFADLDESIGLFTQVLTVKPRSVDTYNSRAVAYLERGRPGDEDLAIADLTRAISIDPADASAYINRAVATLERGNPQDLNRTFSDLRQAIAIDPNLAVAYVNRGNAYVLRGGAGDVDLALADFSKAAELEPKSPIAFFNRGLLYSELEEWEKSNVDLREAQKLNPEDVTLNSTLCRQLAVQRKGEEALGYCELAVAAEPEGMALDSRGLARAVNGDREGAIADFTAFLEWVEASPEDTCGETVGPSREAWITELKAGRNPFDDETLRQMRGRLAPPGSSRC